MGDEVFIFVVDEGFSYSRGRKKRTRAGGERKEDTYQLGLASSLELSYLKCGRGVFDEIGITQSQEGD